MERSCAPGESYAGLCAFFFFDFLYMPPPGFSFRAICMDGVVVVDVSFLCFFFFDFLYMPPPGFSFRAIFMDCVVDVDLNSGMSVTAVEPAAWADSDKATRPAAPRSVARTNDFMFETSLVVEVPRRTSRALSRKASMPSG